MVPNRYDGCVNPLPEIRHNKVFSEGAFDWACTIKLLQIKNRNNNEDFIEGFCTEGFLKKTGDENKEYDE